MATVHDAFPNRHIGPDRRETREILDVLGYTSTDELARAALPASIVQDEPIGLPPALDETGVLAALRGYASRNVVKKQLIGAGYHDTVTPAVIRRNVVENPGWYTAYTPYQPEISQGRLEALLNFQTAVEDLTGLPVAGASLLDEATAVAEAVQMMVRVNTKAAKAGGVVLLDADLHPSSIAVTCARAEAAGIPVEIVGIGDAGEGTDRDDLVGVVVSNPGTTGRVRDLRPVVEAVKARGGLVTVACDLLAQVLVESPGAQGADIAVGSAQRFGVPLFFGGPHAAFLACAEGMQRKLPGRIVGVSVDSEGTPAYRLALQTREQHIRRDKATSNICTAQALLAVVAGFYAVWHGPEGLREIATAVHGRAVALAVALSRAGLALAHDAFFDTVTVDLGSVAGGGSAGDGDGATPADRAVRAACVAGFNIRRIDDTHVGVSVGESTTDADIVALTDALVGTLTGEERHASVDTSSFTPADGPLADVLREDDILTHPVFHSVSSETEMMRYLRRLADRDLALDRTMIPLGSCTMNSTPRCRWNPSRGRSSRASTRSRPSTRCRAGSTSSPTSRTGSRGSPATPGCPSSRTPARRASSPGSSRSAATTAPAGTTGGRSSSSPRPRTGRTRRPPRSPGCGSSPWPTPGTGPSTSTTSTRSSRRTATRSPAS